MTKIQQDTTKEVTLRPPRGHLIILKEPEHVNALELRPLSSLLNMEAESESHPWIVKWCGERLLKQVRLLESRSNTAKVNALLLAKGLTLFRGLVPTEGYLCL